ncbi:hypothetical protein DERF_006151 [Dermatophagoides farinae]|uniref:Uncharacterized protein n=1 Tax=Dermatophagoides farinae TaxID=6954 RepID=A0A922I6Y5_DERFA|nr:hypothetical protein DERF_006151 [Dermatophagoides farinae]
MYRDFYRQYMQQYRKIISVILDNWPLRKQLGFYSYLPIFFAIGAWTEFSMIHMRINGIDFYSVYKRKEQERLLEEQSLRNHHFTIQNIINDKHKNSVNFTINNIHSNVHMARMPFGLSWSTYLSRIMAALLATACGSQFIHSIYRPLESDRIEQMLETKRVQLEQQSSSSTTTTTTTSNITNQS